MLDPPQHWKTFTTILAQHHLFHIPILLICTILFKIKTFHQLIWLPYLFQLNLQLLPCKFGPWPRNEPLQTSCTTKHASNQ